VREPCCRCRIVDPLFVIWFRKLGRWQPGLTRGLPSVVVCSQYYFQRNWTTLLWRGSRYLDGQFSQPKG
jgi:hypothetical protein